MRVGACLDARLQHAVEHPVVLALSGGGDSMALLHIAADWAKARGRRLLAVTVDHGLNPDSPGWSETCRHACAALNVAWTERRWIGEKPSTGLPAAARHARHALLADAAREAGARVILLAHTADDISEGDWMRERGTPLGTLREWSPSPAWPGGWGLMLLRPMLGQGRGALRAWLRDRDAGWIEDPANDDIRFTRSRARQTLTPLPQGEGLSARERQRSVLRERVRGAVPTGQTPAPHPFGLADRFALRASSPLPLGEGITLQNPPPTALAAAIVCTSGGTAIPRADRIAALTARITAGVPFTATLSGARITADGTTPTLTREPGDLRRRPVPDRPLTPGLPTVWDGRYEITAAEPGWTVTAALGHLAALSPADRAIARTVTPHARAVLPILIRDDVLYRNDHRGPVLAWRVAEVRALVPRRLDLALSALGMGETTHEADLFRPLHGETPPSDLFSSARHETDARHAVPPKDREPK